MEWVVIPLLGILGWILGVVGFFKSQRALSEVRLLRAALQGMQAQPQAAVWAAPAPVSETPPPEPEPEPEPETRPEPEMPPGPELPPVREPVRARADLEVLLTQRWGVWLGAAALLLAAVFLVRTAVEQGWLGPGPRCAMAALLGAGLVGCAEWLRRRPSGLAGFADLGPAALASGGVAAWFAGAYGAGPLYGLVSPMAGFVLLAAAGLAGMALSLRYGRLAGLAGLAGAFVTPLLVTTDDVSAPGLFAYLLFVSAAAWAVVRYTAWAWLGWAAAAAGAIWVMPFAVFGAKAELWAPGLFVPAAAALSLFLLPGAALETGIGRRLAWAPVGLLGLAGLALAAATGSEMARLGVLLLAPVTVAKGLWEPRLAWLPHLAGALFLLVLLSWALPAWQATGEAIVAGDTVQAILPGAWAPAVIVPLLETAAAMAAWFALSGLFGERWSGRPVPWASLAALMPVATLAVTYAQVGQFQPAMGWAFAAAGLAAALVGAAWLARPGIMGVQRAGMYAAGAVAALSLGFAIVLDQGWLTMAVALLLPALAWIEGAAELPPLRWVALLTALLVLVRLVLNPYVLDYAVGTWPVLNGLLPAYGVPAACFAAASVMFRRRRDDTLVAVLEGGACAFFAALAGLEVHHWAAGGVLRSLDSGFLEFALHVSVLGGVALLLHVVALRGGRVVVAVAARIAGGLALAGGVLMIAANPVVTDEPVGLTPFWNALLPAYAIPAVLAIGGIVLGARPRAVLAAYAGAAAFMWVTLSVRHAFHPEAMGVGSDFEDAELWAYSGAWLLMGAALMALGLRTGARSLRLAALALVGLAAAKVFLVDMAGLDGLWRVLSFLGLGVSLIGLGAFYRRFVVRPA